MRDTETASRLRGRIERVRAGAIARDLRGHPNPAAWRDNLQALLAAPRKIDLDPARRRRGRGSRTRVAVSMTDDKPERVPDPDPGEDADKRKPSAWRERYEASRREYLRRREMDGRKGEDEGGGS